MQGNSLTPTRATAIAVLLIAAGGLAAYANGFTDLFLGLDAKQSIRDNPHIRSLWPLSEALSLPLWGSVVVTEQHPSVAYRPTYSFLLALTHHFFGLAPQAFHAVALGIHILAGLVLFGLVRRTASRWSRDSLPADRATWFALAVALVWLLHPLQTESVTYFAQLSEASMGLMLFVAIGCAARAIDGPSRRGWQAAAVAACALSMGSKQSAVILPLLVLSYDHVFGADDGRRRYRPGFYVALAVPVAISTALILSQAQKAVGANWAISYALAQPGVILHYLRLAVWPDDLYLYVNTTTFSVESPWQALPPALVLTSLLLIAVWGLVHRRWFGFLGAWFFLTLAPTSSILPITDTIQEHRMYLPLAALAVLAVLAGDALVRRLFPHPSGGSARILARMVLIAAVLAGLGARTHARNADYHHEFAPIHPADVHESYRILADHALSDPEILAAEAERARATLASSAVHPRDVPYAHFILGLDHAQGGRFEAAAGELERTVEADSNFAYAYHRWGVVLRQSGDLAGASQRFREAIRLEPAFVYSYTDLAAVLVERGEFDAASEQLALALRSRPGFAEAHYQLGLIALERDDRAAAAASFQEAVADRRDHADAQFELGMLLRDGGDAVGARKHLSQAVRWQPESAQAQYELGCVLRELGEEDLAIEALRAAVRLRPQFAEAHEELGSALADVGDAGAAREHLQAALRLDPTLAYAHLALGMLGHAEGDGAAAIRSLEAALSLQPEMVEAHRALATVLRDRGDLAGALQRAEVAVRLDPEDEDATRLRAQIQSMIGGGKSHCDAPAPNTLTGGR